VTIDEDTYSAIIVPVLEEHFTDTDEEGILSYTASALGVGLDSLSINTGLIVYPTENFAGYVDIMVIASDTYGASVADTLMLTIENINDAPVVITALPDVTIDEDDFGAVIIPSLEEYFGDVDVGDVLIFTGDALGEGLDSLSFSTDDGFNAMGRMSNYHGTKIMTIKRFELKQRSSSKVFTPQQLIKDKSDQKGLNSFNENSGIIDTPKNRSTSKGALQQPDKDLFDKQFVIIDSDIIDTRKNRSLSRTDSTALIVYPTGNFVGDIDIMIIASDTTGEYAVDTLTLTIENINDSPVLATIEDQTTNEDTATSVILSATDIDGDSLIFSASSGDTNFTTIVIDDTLTITPAPNWNGQAAITVIVTDNGLGSLSDTTTFTVTVNAVNDSPVLTNPLPDVTIDEDDFGAIIIPALEAHFVDIDEDDILSYTGSALGEGLDSLSFSTDDGFSAMGRMVNYHGARIMTIKRSAIKKHPARKGFSPLQNNRDKSVKQDILSFGADTDILNTRQNSSNSRTDSTDLIVYPTENFVGDIDIMIIASDTTGEYAVDTLTLTIENINDAPFVANAIADIEVDEDSEPVTLNINGVFDDADILVGDSLTITAISLADTLVTVEYDSNSVPILVFSENGNGETDIIVTAADLIGLTVNDTVHVSILSVNDAPTEFGLLSPFDSTELFITPNDISQELTLLVTWESSSDVDGDDLSYEFVLYNGVYGPDTPVLIDTVLLDTVLHIPYVYIAELIGMSGQTSISADWVVFTTDGIDTTMSNHVWNILFDASDVLSIDGGVVPDKFALYQNYPNPFNPITQIRYDLPEDAMVNITIYDIMGRSIRSLVKSRQTAGYRLVRWDATNDKGESVSAGMYFYTIQAEDFRQAKKMVLLK